jgi:peptide/nickel transport system ATP-binding protein
MADTPLLSVEDLRVHFPVGRRFFGGVGRVARAVDGVSFTVAAGETVGLVGESGSGKTSIARAVIRRERVTSGVIRFRGEDITRLSGRSLRALRRSMQMVFQDPSASLNPRMTIGEIVAEPLVIHGIARGAAAAARVRALLARVGLPRDAADRLPYAFSGGQLQRVGIARALAVDPAFLVADEPVSALDVSIRAQVVNLLQDLQAETGLGLLFIAHDLAVVRHISHRVVILYAGKVMEQGKRDLIFADPLHPYTRSLLAAVPEPDPAVRRRVAHGPLQGETPSPIDPPPGCRFAARCPIAEPRCRAEEPALEEKRPGRLVACWRVPVGALLSASDGQA